MPFKLIEKKMDPDHRKILQSNFVKLSELISLNDVVPLLLEKHIFTEHMIEDILAENTDTDRKHKLMLDLPRRGPNAFQKFLDILLKTENYDAALILDPDIKIPNVVSSEYSSSFTSSFKHISITSGHSKTVNEGTDQHFVRPATEWKEGPDYYKMSSRPRGYCLIINNVLFQNILPERFGSYEDARKLDVVFHELGYEVIFRSDQTAQEILGLTKKFSEKPEHEQVDSCVVIILSHGDYNIIYGSDAEKVQLDTILNFFNNDNCQRLRGKPKMFFIQACQGDNYDRGVSICCKADSKPYIQQIIQNASQPIMSASSCLQTWSDMLISHSTLPGHISYRNEISGSWYGQALASVLMEHAHEMDLLHMLLKVDQIVKEHINGDGKKQATETITLGWSGRLYFNPGLFK